MGRVTWLQRVDLKGYLLKKVGAAKMTVSGAEHQIDCPLCDEKGGRRDLWINVEKRVGICYRCDTYFDPLKLVMDLEGCRYADAFRILKDHSSLASVSTEALKKRVAKALAEDEGVQEDEGSELPTIKPPVHFRVARDPEEWPAYFARVGGEKLIRDFGIGWSEQGFYGQRMIVPIRQGERWVSFIARAMWKACKACKGKGCKLCCPCRHKWDDKECLRCLPLGRCRSTNPDGCEVCGHKFRKVLYPKGCKTGNMLFNYDRAQAFRHVVLTEGVFDALRVGPRGMAVLGSRISDRQLALLLASKARHVSILFDGDAAGRKGAAKARERLAPFFKVSVVRLPQGIDPDDLPRAALWERIGRAPDTLGAEVAARVRAALL